MSDFFVELFSEEIPAGLQIDAREKIKKIFEEHLTKRGIEFKSSKSFSTPKRLVFLIEGIPKKIQLKEKILKGPKVGAPETALRGFLKSNNLDKSDLYEQEIEKGKFYFATSKPKNINVLEELQSIIPQVLSNYSWKKTMKWANYQLNWGRPLKSILALFCFTCIQVCI